MERKRSDMKLYIKQRVFSWTDTYDVYGANQIPKYFVKAEFFTIGHKIHIYDHASGNEVGVIREKLFTMFGGDEISAGGRELGSITKHFSFLRPKYSIDYNGWGIEGDFFGWDYSITDRYGETVALISKELFNWGDTYSLEIFSDSNELDALMTVIAIDMLNCGRS